MTKLGEKDRGLTVSQAADVLGKHSNTVLFWEKEGLLKSTRTTGGHRRFLLSDLLVFKKELQHFERTGATLARRIFMNTCKQGKVDDPTDR